MSYLSTNIEIYVFNNIRDIISIFKYKLKFSQNRLFVKIKYQHISYFIFKNDMGRSQKLKKV